MLYLTHLERRILHHYLANLWLEDSIHNIPKMKMIKEMKK